MKAPGDVPSLLTMPHYAGTLAAARYLADRGVHVVMASDRVLAPAMWSRHVQRRIAAPRTSKGPAFLANWLCRYGQSQPPMMLHPTSDDMAFVIARYADQLRQHFHLLVPPLSTLRTVLDKSALYAVCLKLGIPSPETWFPRNEADVAGLCSDDRPLLLKPRAQMFYPGGKGELVIGRQQRLRAWRMYRHGRYAPGVLEEFPDFNLPMLQEYEPSAVQGTYSISGFVDRSGRVLGARASTKVMQTARVGTGLCFVASEVAPTPLLHIQLLCKNIGYFGTFEAEFVQSGNRHLLIDFNPRYYGQMGFDIARGVPHPWLTQQAALGDTKALDSFAATPAPPGAPRVHHDRVALTWWVGKALASGAIGLREAARWHGMADDLAQASVDASWRRDDPIPTLVSAAAMAWNSLRYPITFWRSLRQNSDPYQQPVARLV
jgi:predicted ATP-grasp superfamily ATP-dependent carboligase